MISLTTKYAIRALDYLARDTSGEFLSVKKLAEETGVAAPYLSKVMKSLAVNDLIESKKGLKGGVRLKQQGPALTLFEVANCLDDPVARESCFLSRQECRVNNTCQFHSRWSGLRSQILNFLHETVIWDPNKSGNKNKR